MNWIQTYVGAPFFVLSPKIEDIKIEDIAHSLSLLCRFNGHCTHFYSVAEHSLRVMDIVQEEFKLAALLHDAAEAYYGDLPKPLKQLLPEYQDAENKTICLIAKKFGFQWPLPYAVKKADRILLATEKRDLMNEGFLGWNLLEKPLERTIVPNSICTRAVEKDFINAFNELLSPSKASLKVAASSNVE